MRILPPPEDLVHKAKKYGIIKKFQKALILLEHNTRHPSLHTELLEPKHMKIFSFRIDKKYRGIFIYRDTFIIEILQITNHYQ
jgi:plasmid maintenance system killer protein